MKLRILSVFVVLMSLTSCIKKQVEGVQVVDIATYEKQLNQPEVQLIDVRTPEEFSQGHLENAKNINIMAEDFDAQVASLDKSKPVMVYCKSGGRSARAADVLKEKRFKQVYDLDGGIMGWKASNKPVEN